jgi:hypothetical protein
MMGVDKPLTAKKANSPVSVVENIFLRVFNGFGRGGTHNVYSYLKLHAVE